MPLDPLAHCFLETSDEADDIAKKDELDKYLELPMVKDHNLDILAWWKAQSTQTPVLSKMARQYLGRPASSAGVERIFSKAGKMHDGSKSVQADSTLEHALFVCASSACAWRPVDRWPCRASRTKPASRSTRGEDGGPYRCAPSRHHREEDEGEERAGG